jgi:hypothetical protein
MDQTVASHASPSPSEESPPRRRKKDRRHPILRWLLGVGEEFLLLVLLTVTFVLSFAPVLLALVGGGIALVDCLQHIILMWQAFKDAQYDVILTALPTLGSAVKIVCASLAYLALLFAMNVLISGMIGQRKQHLYIIPGLVLSLLALLAYTVASFILIGTLASMTGWGELPFVILFGYIGVNAAWLGLMITDLRPASRRLRREQPYDLPGSPWRAGQKETKAAPAVSESASPGEEPVGMQEGVLWPTSDHYQGYAMQQAPIWLSW